jgi:hypothetical protein
LGKALDLLPSTGGGARLYIFGLAVISVGQFEKLEIELVLKKKNIKNPIEIIFSACSFMQYWTGLQSLDTQMAIDEGVNLMLKTAFKLLGKQAKTVHGPLLPGGSDGADGGGINKTPGGQ